MPLILVVDDEPLIRRLVRQFLGPRHEVIEAGSAEQALDFAHLRRPDLVVLDIGLPGVLDGLDALFAMRRHTRLRDIPVVILSGHGLQGESCGMPVDAYFTKPFKPSDLVACIERLLDQSLSTTALQGSA